MPAGVSWPTYLKATTAALMSMFFGAQVVHHLYRPLDGLDDLVKLEVEAHRKALAKARLVSEFSE